ncbi:MAG: hypothetical protein PHN45_04320 [Methylococcales bacterium]|nr:hypothetical protein [Methylococcales bacterium]MDD5753960.1 hypothetical protein [Methylococcales bacterium]
MTEEKKTGVSFECTQQERQRYLKAAGGKKLGAWIKSVLDAAVRQQSTGGKSKTTNAKTVIDYQEDDYDSIGNK